MEADVLMTKPLPVLLESLGHCVLLSATIYFISLTANEANWSSPKKQYCFFLPGRWEQAQLDESVSQWNTCWAGQPGGACCFSVSLDRSLNNPGYNEDFLPAGWTKGSKTICILNSNMHVTHMGVLLPCRFWVNGSDVGAETLHFYLMRTQWCWYCRFLVLTLSSQLWRPLRVLWKLRLIVPRWGILYGKHMDIASAAQLGNAC